MPDQPFLIFPRPVSATRTRLGGGGARISRPTARQQRQRLEAKFQAIAAGLQDVQANVVGMEPEQVIVLETFGTSVEQVAKAAAKIPGLEWLAEKDLKDAQPQYGFQNEKDAAATLPVRLYALFTNQQAMNALLGLWEQWTQDPNARAKQGYGQFKNLFIYLRDIRRWGPKDRIEATGILQRWLDEIAVKGAQGTIRFEVELWFRSDPAKRQAAYAAVNAIVAAAGGNCLHTAAIPEIAYHGVLAELPANVIQDTIASIQSENYTQLLRSEGVMFFRPQAQTYFPAAPALPSNFDFEARLAGQPNVEGSPVVAVLDGVPLENHRALQGRVIVDDPENHAQYYNAGEQKHGTSMSSLILHGDLAANGASLRNPLYLRPILYPEDMQRVEQVPPNRLLIDLVHAAVRRIFEGEGDQVATAPRVRIINFSVGNVSQPFDREMSPLGRLLDWLSWKYKVLFIVSIGNCDSDIAIEALESQWEGLTDDELVSQVLTALRADQYKRRPLSPAEAINSVAVGSVHADEGGDYTIGARVDLLKAKRLPSPISTVSNGFRRATKPDILLPGGRQLYQRPLGNGADSAKFSVATVTSPPGCLTAAPGLAPLETGRVWNNCGTSNAAALASRCAALAYEKIRALEIPEDADPLSPEHEAVLLKALLVHGASWGSAANTIKQMLNANGPDWQSRMRLIQQFLGYGEVRIERCLGATNQRATLLGWGTIADGEGNIFSLPLPPSLSASKELRRLTTTLAWFTTTNHQHRNYRKAHLFLTVPESDIGTKTIGLDAKSAQRGTVEHRIFEGDAAKAFLEGATLSIQVNCKEDGGQLNENIPYAVAVTLEVGENVNIDVYQEISVRLRQVVQIPTGAAQ